MRHKLTKQRWLLLVAVLFTIYVVLLLANAYRSQDLLRKAAEARLLADSRQLTAVVGDFLDEQRNFAVNLAESHEIETFLINKALGMSIRYGLNVNLESIETSFRRKLTQKTALGSQVYKRILYLDEGGKPLVDTLPDAPRIPSPLQQENEGRVVIDAEHDRIISFAPVDYRGVPGGTVATVTDLSVLSRYLPASAVDFGYYRLIITDSGRELVLPGATTSLPKGVAAKLSSIPLNTITSLSGIPGREVAILAKKYDLAVRLPITGRALSLLILVSSSFLYGNITSRLFLYTVSIAPLVFLAAAIWIERVQRKAQRLEADVLESNRNRAELQQRNDLLLQEIAHREALERELRKSEERNRTYIDHAPEGIFVANAIGRFVDVNPSACAMVGYTSEELLGITITDLSPPGLLEDYLRFFERVKHSGPHETEMLLRTKEGKVLVTSFRAIALPGELVMGFCVDITESKQAAEDLRQSNERLRLISDNIPNGMTFQLDTGISGEMRQFTYVSAGVEKLHGMDASALVQDAQLLYQQFLEPDQALLAAEEEKAVVAMKSFYAEARHRTKSGEIRWSLITSSPHRAQNGHLLWDGVEIDITDRKSAEEKITRAGIEWSAAMDASEDAVYLLDPTRHLLRANKVFYRMTGSTPERAIGQHIASFIHPNGEETPCPVCSAQEGLRDEIIQMESDHPDNPAGVPIEITVTVVRGPENHPISILMRLHDLTEQRKIENALRYSKAEWERTFDALSDIATIQDRNMRIVRANKAACDAFQTGPEGLVGKYCYEIFRGTHQPCQNCPESLTLQSGEIHSSLITHENLGKVFYVTSSPVLNENGQLTRLIHIARDITEQKKMEAELFQAHKMEAIGTLAGGIAHDFNNILAAILGYTELAKDDIPASHQARDCLDQVLKAGHRARELVKQILTFSRKGQESQLPVQPYIIIKEGIKLMRASLPSSIEIHEKIDTESGIVIADPTGIHQILVNLCTNAFHAMADEKGVLTVKLTKVELRKEDTAFEPGISAGAFIELVVSDTGCGMDQKTMARIFEPYFTTKEIGKGSGMGLALVHGIVQGCGGFIRVESKLGEGSAFHVYLPSADMKTETAMEKPKEDPLPGGKERILVVDDEEVIVGMYEAALKQLGYSVSAYDDSKMAIEAFLSSPNDFDIVITDQTMPNIVGSELARQMLNSRPDIPIILCTGYSAMISEEKAEEIGIKRFLMKPVSRKDLAITVREELDRINVA